MTFAAAKGSGKGAGARRGRVGVLRALVWALHVLVSFVAVFSLFTNRFDLWVDLRLLGGAGAAVVKILWVGATLLVPWCAGPRMVPRWCAVARGGERPAAAVGAGLPAELSALGAPLTAFLSCD